MELNGMEKWAIGSPLLFSASLSLSLSSRFTFVAPITFSPFYFQIFDVNHAVIEPDEMSVPCVFACLCKRTNERASDRENENVCWMFIINIEQLDNSTSMYFLFSIGRSCSGQVWNHNMKHTIYVFFRLILWVEKYILPNPWLFKCSCFMLCACTSFQVL